MITSQECIFCNGNKNQLLFTKDSYQIVKCSKCGLVRTEGGSSISYYNYHRDQDYIKFYSRFRNILEYRVRLIKRFRKRPGKVLDVGSSTGTLLRIFKKDGWECWGIDPSESFSLSRAKSIKVIKNIFEKASLPSNYFNVLVFNHTLEHLDNPFKALGKAYRVLKKEGLILVDVPNFGSLSSRILGSNWPYLLPTEHKYHFTKESLKGILAKAGFKVVYTETRSGIWDYSNPFHEIMSNLLHLKEKFFLDVFTLFPSLIMTKIGLGTGLTVVAEKTKSS